MKEVVASVGPASNPKGPKRAPKKVTKSRGEKSVTANPHTQVGELAMLEPNAEKPMTHGKRLREMSKEAKFNATRRWVGGEISTKVHDSIHSKANHVLRKPSKYFGMKESRRGGVK